jgi:selenocysteine-specific elongation factor
LQDTRLRDAEIVSVSAKTRRGLNELQYALENALARVDEKTDRRRPRLPIDRVFTMSGFGTVVTGTLSDGSWQVGQDVEIAPRSLRSRIRGLQSHKQKLETAQPGGRVAVNLANVSTDEVQRGDVVILPDTYTPTTMLDAHIEWLESAPKPLAHSQELELFLYASQVMTRVRLLAQDALLPGQRGWAQLLLETPVVAAKGDRFILRYPSPSITVGGGEIVEPHPTTRHKRNRSEVIAQLERALRGTPAELTLQFIEAHPASNTQEIVEGVALDGENTRAALDELRASGEIIALGAEHAPLYLSHTTWARWQEKIVKELAAYHKQFPLRAGMPREEFKSRLNFAPRAFEPVVAYAGAQDVLRATEKHIALTTHRVTFDAQTQQKINTLLEQFARAPYNPPSVGDVEDAIGVEALNALVEQAVLVRVAPNVLFTPDVVEAMQTWVLETLHDQNEITAAQLRDRFDTSRKYAIAFLEYLDTKRITRRVGDARVLR